jgi:hypothetical protein
MCLLRAVTNFWLDLVFGKPDDYPYTAIPDPPPPPTIYD